MAGQSAWQQPETRRSYAAYRLGALRWFAGGLAGGTVAVGLSAYAVLVLKRPGLGVFIVAALFLGVIGLVTGTGGLIRAQRFRRTLQTQPWQSAELRVAGASLRLIFAADDVDNDTVDNDAVDSDAVDIDANGDDRRAADVRLLITSRWRVREVVGHRDGEVLVCSARDGSYVLSAQGLNNLYGLRPLARLGGRYRP
ncbi:MAG: hypothetical protein H0T40_13240 [Geodermatophilaceae bacterium]|nr:hypothetical protein [Geodermatophilaceae bacterium]